ncbi:hypothetical protein SAMN05421678_108252 [Actinopolymorpha cephalotaxi]|uniref:Uncharacterized protein n=1 Tax=Actinopolymorpha cephalotaxi TaxID=504797 RepID=A0A1I2US44_9ACTN|nr:hypothetical protein [Actinopolymorpha cephalotaxi]NYH86666.1 hypothetical protein [Actinopolymorpha cephalotaxi]SFG78597.1 hypothetical protein SAMN05421678_108252 [Actinopolymorpha cephalotaxi]
MTHHRRRRHYYLPTPAWAVVLLAALITFAVLAVRLIHHLLTLI